ncbi:NLR family CARD domain-containing protein 4-like [Branchiostoma floridae x Branchiostoma belcheri]
MGKTTFLSKKALDAVSSRTELGRRHDIVLLIRLREVREGDTIEEIVWDQCVPETTKGIDVQSIKAILQRNESRVLFLLDGYDELRPKARADKQAIPKLLSGKLYLKSTIVITSRPSAGVPEHTHPDCHIHITGFSSEQVKKYVEQYFTITGNPEQAAKLINILERSRLVTDMIHAPIFLLLVCLLWEGKPEMVFPGTMTELYENLVTCMGRKHCKREGVDMPGEKLPTELADSLLQFGKLALETLLELSELAMNHVNRDLILKLGFVSLEATVSKLHPRKQLNFSHKTMQEFLAGRYAAHVLKNHEKSIVEPLHLTSITKVLEHNHLLQFTCGCDSLAAQVVTEELSKLSRKEYSNLQPEDFKKPHISAKPEMKKLVESYRTFCLIGLGILNERKHPDILRAISKALPVIILDKVATSKWHAVLTYYFDNFQFVHLPDRMMVGISDCDDTPALTYLEQTFTSSIQGLQLDINMSYVQLDSSDKTTRVISVMRNVPGLRTLDASCTEITPSSMKPLVQGFRHVPLLEELDLTGNYGLGDAGMEVLQVGLSTVPHLAVFRLRAVGMTAVGMASLAPYMCHLMRLRELDLSYKEIGDTGLESLTTILHTFTAMQVLILWHIGISTTGMKKLTLALRQLSGLIKLDLGDNAIGDPGLECLAAILHHLTAMKVLILSQTGISDKRISSLVKALHHLLELQVLDVLDNRMQDSGIVSLVQTLCQPSSLDMEQNPPGDKSLTTAHHHNTTLHVQELYIGGNEGVTGAGLGRVA